MSRLAIIALCTLLLSSCWKDNQCNIPFGAGGTIDITMPEFAALQNVGGSMTINRGYRGIFIRRISYSDFVAFECACPKDNDERLKADADWGGAVLQCDVCGSRFETEYGTPLSGSATPCMLYQYSTSFNGTLLEIY